MTIIFLSDIPWSGLHQRPQHIALALAKHWKVLWVEPAILSHKFHFRPIEVEHGIYGISVPAIPYNARSKFVQLLAKSLSAVIFLRKSLLIVQLFFLKRALKEIGSYDDSIGFFIQNFHLIDLVNKFKVKFVLYDYIDNAFAFTELPKHVEAWWMKTITRADIITVTSPGLSQQIQQHRKHNIHYVGNGVEFKFFSDKSAFKNIPDDLPRDKPIVGYIGAVYPWLDYDLIEYVIKTLPQINYVFIGTVHPKISDRIEILKRMGNVHILGFKSYAQIPSYLQRFDIGIIPFQRNELTKTVNPVKLYEYCAAGKPTVATDFSDDIREFKEIVHIAKSREEFVSSIKNCLDESIDPMTVNKLKSFAEGHDWQIKTSQIIKLISEELLTQKE